MKQYVAHYLRSGAVRIFATSDEEALRLANRLTVEDVCWNALNLDELEEVPAPAVQALALCDGAVSTTTTDSDHDAQVVVRGRS